MAEVDRERGTQEGTSATAGLAAGTDARQKAKPRYHPRLQALIRWVGGQCQDGGRKGARNAELDRAQVVDPMGEGRREGLKGAAHRSSPETRRQTRAKRVHHQQAAQTIKAGTKTPQTTRHSTQSLLVLLGIRPRSLPPLIRGTR